MHSQKQLLYTLFYYSTIESTVAKKQILNTMIGSDQASNKISRKIFLHIPRLDIQPTACICEPQLISLAKTATQLKIPVAEERILCVSVLNAYMLQCTEIRRIEKRRSRSIATVFYCRVFSSVAVVLCQSTVRVPQKIVHTMSFCIYRGGSK